MDSVQAIYAVAQEQCNGSSVELKYSFPPKDLIVFQDQTIGGAKLAGESIQGRVV
jgi:NOL1/NOP2/fmu family ribosome biogenesis protein